MADKITPEVGMAATYGIMADQYPMIIVKVLPKSVYVEHADFDRETREVTRREGNRRGEARRFMLKEDGSYRGAGNRKWGYLHIGTANDYRDPNH